MNKLIKKINNSSITVILDPLGHKFYNKFIIMFFSEINNNNKIIQFLGMVQVTYYTILNDSYKIQHIEQFSLEHREMIISRYFF